MDESLGSNVLVPVVVVVGVVVGMASNRTGVVQVNDGRLTPRLMRDRPSQPRDAPATPTQRTSTPTSVAAVATDAPLAAIIYAQYIEASLGAAAASLDGLPAYIFDQLFIDMGAQLSALIDEALEFETSLAGGRPGFLKGLHATVDNARSVVGAFKFIREDLDLDDDRKRRDVYMSAQRRFELTQNDFVVLRHVASSTIVLEPVD